PSLRRPAAPALPALSVTSTPCLHHAVSYYSQAFLDARSRAIAMARVVVQADVGMIHCVEQLLDLFETLGQGACVRHLHCKGDTRFRCQTVRLVDHRLPSWASLLPLDLVSRNTVARF